MDLDKKLTITVILILRVILLKERNVDIRKNLQIQHQFLKGNLVMIGETDTEQNMIQKEMLFLKVNFQMVKDGKDLERKIKIKKNYLKGNIKMEKEKNIIMIFMKKKKLLNSMVII